MLDHHKTSREECIADGLYHFTYDYALQIMPSYVGASMQVCEGVHMFEKYASTQENFLLEINPFKYSKVQEVGGDLGYLDREP